MDSPEVSVLLPVKNGYPFVEQAIQGILNQHFTDLELIVINDGSTDDTASVLDRLSIDKRLKIITLENSVGVPAALNLGLSASSGKYIARQDADDWSYPERLKRQVSYLKNNPDCWLVGCQGEYINEVGEVIRVSSFPETGEEIIQQILQFNTPFFHGAWMFTRACYDKVGVYNELFFGTEDKDYLLRISEQGDVANLSDNLYRYRIHSGAVTSGNLMKRRLMRKVILRLYQQRKTHGKDTLGTPYGGYLDMHRVNDAVRKSLNDIFLSMDSRVHGAIKYIYLFKSFRCLFKVYPIVWWRLLMFSKWSRKWLAGV